MVALDNRYTGGGNHKGVPLRKKMSQESIDYLRLILSANVYRVAVESSLDFAPKLSRRMGNSIWLKREDLQPVFSFKLRGAYNKMVHLSEAELRQGVITSSAGNHAQGVALAARELGTDATIVMPLATPEIKVEAVRNMGAKVVLHGDSYDAAQAKARALEEERGLTFIHPFDDPYVISGNGTIGVEILHQHDGALDAIFVPIGGGGLISGIAQYVKYLRPEVKIIGVEPERSPTMKTALEQGALVELDEVGLFADGVAVKKAGMETFKLCQQYVDEVVLVSTDEICAAIKDAFEDTRSILEPAGALSIAGCKKYIEAGEREGGKYIAVASGANMNFDRLRHVSERSELGEAREAIFAVTIPEKPGSFKAFCEQLGERNITEFNYRYHDPDRAEVFVGISVSGREEIQQLLTGLNHAGLTAVNLTDNELAKVHVRHMVGGRAVQVDNEVVYRFAFPDRPGALMRFLENMAAGWNISLFHYRNHGSDYGRVLVGLQVPEQDRSAFDQFLQRVGYAWHDETGNPAYQLFLQA